MKKEGGRWSKLMSIRVAIGQDELQSGWTSIRCMLVNVVVDWNCIAMYCKNVYIITLFSLPISIL